MKVDDLVFVPIDLERHADLCVKFREDSYTCSFGSAEKFHESDGKGAERYIDWLRQRMQEIPNSCVHVWKDNEIIGQIEMRRWRIDPSVGYVNLYYLIPEYRGRGIGCLLDEHVGLFFKQLGCKKARLSVSPSNTAAMKFYLKRGWKDLGPREDAPEVHYMEKYYENRTRLKTG